MYAQGEETAQEGGNFRARLAGAVPKKFFPLANFSSTPLDALKMGPAAFFGQVFIG